MLQVLLPIFYALASYERLMSANQYATMSCTYFFGFSGSFGPSQSTTRVSVFLSSEAARLLSDAGFSNIPRERFVEEGSGEFFGLCRVLPSDAREELAVCCSAIGLQKNLENVQLGWRFIMPFVARVNYSLTVLGFVRASVTRRGVKHPV